MSMYGSRAVGSYGAFGQAFSGFGGAALELFSGGPSFVGPDDPGIFLGTNTGFIQGAAGIGYKWIPPTDAFMTSVGNAWFTITQSQNPNDAAFITSTTAHLNTLLASFSGQVANHSTLGYSQSAQQMVVSYANQIKAVLTAILAYQIGPQPAPPTLPQTYLPPTGTVSQGATAAGTWDTTSGGLATSTGADTAAPDNTLLYVGLGIGAIVLVGGGIFLVKRRRSASVAGYRRSRRSRR